MPASIMRATVAAAILVAAIATGSGRGAGPAVIVAEEKQENNLVSVLLEVSSIKEPGNAFTFTRPAEGWIFLTATCRGSGIARIKLDDEPGADAILVEGANAGKPAEAMRRVAAGLHRIRVECARGTRVDNLAVKAIPELIHCGLGFDPAIKSYGRYDLDFLKKDILPNVTTLIVPSNVNLTKFAVDDWHRQGKKLVAEVGIDGNAKTADEHYKFWAGFYAKFPFLDGIIINEFIVNNPQGGPGRTLSPARRERMKSEQEKYRVYGEAIKKMRAADRDHGKMLYGYVGGSGKKLNQEIIGPDFIRTIIDCGYRVALERYIFEVSSERKSKDVLQLFVDGIADWEARERGVKKRMVITFGLFSMPPGGINKQPNVDYHVWMDQQMNVVAVHPLLAGVAGLNWWTSVLADEETVRFVGRLYRHYGIEGKTSMLTKDPLFLAHIRNPDFQNGLEGWTVQPAEAGAIQAKRFPRYGRIEGRYMGLGRPADPEHIGDTFLWMKRSAKGPNTFSQTIKDLESGRLYSMKLFTCDYTDLIHPQKKSLDEANKFIGRVELEGVELDAQRSFTEMYASNPEPPIPIWITYHWKVFRARGPTAKLTVSDWPSAPGPSGPFGQEQTFNFIEIQPYHE
jgi:hypothetical protein